MNFSAWHVPENIFQKIYFTGGLDTMLAKETLSVKGGNIFKPFE